MVRRRRAQLATVLFTDIVGSSEIAVELGDRRWKVLLEAHHAIVRRALRRHGGKELDTAGDGFFAVFDRQAEAIRCAAEIVDDVRAIGLEIRAGLHVGEAELIAGKVGGVAVHTGARIGAGAGPGEVVVSGVLRDLVPGAGFEFEDLGSRRLKGLPDQVRVWSVRSVDGMDLPPPLDAEEAALRRERAAAGRGSRRAALLIGVGAGLVAIAVLAGIVALGGPDTDDGSAPVAPLPAQTLARIDPDTLRVVDRIPLEADPMHMAFSARRLWILEGGLLEMIPSGSSRPVRVDLTFAGCGLAPTGDGVAVPDCEDHVLHRVDAEGDVSRWIDLPAFGDQVAIVHSGDVIWALLSRSDGGATDRVYKLDARTGDVIGRVVLRDSENDAFGFLEAGGWIWTMNYDTGEIVRVSRTTLTLEAVLEMTQPFSMASNGDRIWIADMGSGETVRIDPLSGEVEHRAELVQGNLTAGPEAAWALDLERLYRIGVDASVVGPVELSYVDEGSSDNPIVFDGKSLWVAVRAPDE